MQTKQSEKSKKKADLLRVIGTPGKVDCCPRFETCGMVLPAQLAK